MAYQVEFSPSARREFKALEQNIKKRIGDKIEQLSVAPYVDAVKLTDKGGDFRVRVGEYRIVYRVTDSRLLVSVVKIAHRRDVYK